jgi:excisionase family DNA binding protein
MAITLVRKPGTPARHVADTPAAVLKLLTIKEAAAFARVSTQTVRRWIKAGYLKIYRAGRQIRINESDLVNLLSSPSFVPMAASAATWSRDRAARHG